MELGVGEGALARGLDLAVRLPPLYLMDMLLIQNLGVWTKPSLAPPTPLNPATVPTNMTEAIANSSDLYSTFAELYGGSPMLLILPHVARFSLCSMLYITSLLVFLLPSNQVTRLSLSSWKQEFQSKSILSLSIHFLLIACKSTRNEKETKETNLYPCSW